MLDLVLVAGFHMEAAGTAIATVLAQIGAFGAAFIFMLRNREKFDFEAKLSYFKPVSYTHLFPDSVRISRQANPGSTASIIDNSRGLTSAKRP